MPLISCSENHFTATLRVRGAADSGDRWHNGSLDTHRPIWVIEGFLSNTQHQHAVTQVPFHERLPLSRGN